MTQPNGRINIMDTPITQPSYLNDKIPTNDCCSYEEALRGNIECSALSTAYFSKENMQIIQNAIRATVYKQSNNQYNIAQQDVTTLKIIMRAFYLQNSLNQHNNIPQQISHINNMVVAHCVPKILSEAQAYIKYRTDASTLVVPIDKPKHSGYKNKTNEFKRFF